MTTTTIDSTQHASISSTTPNKALRVGLWIVQGLLAAMFAMTGFMKIATPMAELVASQPWASSMPEGLIRFIGVAELAGAIGLILPSATRVQPKLTAWAATGLLTIMMLASAFHLSRGEAGVLPVNFVLGGLAAFVAWGRFRGAPIAPRA